jgi:thioredoxin reductase (NADPH)
VRTLHPQAKRAVLITYSDRSTAPVLSASVLRQIDWIPKPWQPGDEHFHQAIGQWLYEWAVPRRPRFVAARIVGERWTARSHELRDLLSRNSVPFDFLDGSSEEGRALLREVGADAEALPVVVLFDGQVLPSPSGVEIAGALGMQTRPDPRPYDVAVVGAGPAGLAAAVYGASEGLRTVLIEREAPGGQAGTSSRIENYLGFPAGLSGADLARRAVAQAARFGVEIVAPQEVASLRAEGPTRLVTLGDGAELASHSLIVATGVSYRRLDAPGIERLTGAGVYYGAAMTEAISCRDEAVYIVGGANSAGQAAMHLSKYASRVTLLARGDSLAASMSNYLVKEIEAASNIQVRLNTQVVDGGGEGRLEHLVLKDSASGLTETAPAAALFVLIGAEPRTEWLPEEIEREKQGFIVTGQDLLRNGRPDRGWPLERNPLLLETSMPGVFAAGDVRHRSVKRVASAVGEGSIAIQLVHEYFTKANLGIDRLDSIPDERPEGNVDEDGVALSSTQRSASAI